MITRNSLIDRYLHARARAVKDGDKGLVREIDFELSRRGYKPDATPAVAAHVEEELEAAAKPRRGHPPIRRDV